jgi:hypothetical protein
MEVYKVKPGNVAVQNYRLIDLAKQAEIDMAAGFE